MDEQYEVDLTPIYHSYCDLDSDLPYFPSRPPTLHTIKWAPYVSPEDARLAYKFWSLPESDLRVDIERKGHSFLAHDQSKHALARNVYEHLSAPEQSFGPLSGSQVDSIMERKWTYQEVFGLDDPRKEDVHVNGKSLRDGSHWTVKRLQRELSKRGLDTSGRRQDLEDRLYNEERHRLLPRSDLSHWGINRKGRREQHTIRFTPRNGLNALDMYTSAIQLSPHNPVYWLSRAYCHYRLSFFDLALGDAYRAQLICEAMRDMEIHSYTRGLEEHARHAIEQHIYSIPSEGEMSPEAKLLRGIGIIAFTPTLELTIVNIITLSLLALQCWDDYDAMERYSVAKFDIARRQHAFLQPDQWTVDQEPLVGIRRSREQDDILFHEKKAGACPGGRKYPYDADDKDRYNKKFVDFINKNLPHGFPEKKCEVGIRSIPGRPDRLTLGMFATQPIKKNELIFVSDPSMRGHLSINRLKSDEPVADAGKPRCDNCGRRISQKVVKRYCDQGLDMFLRKHPEGCLCIMEEIPIYFCPQEESIEPTCAQFARECYHHKACGESWQWLHDAMRPQVLDTDDKPHFHHSNEDHCTFLSLILREILDTTLLRRAQTGNPTLMPHELDEMVMLESHSDWDSQYFPFTLAANIQVPFDILMNMGVDIFSDLAFDTWTIQTVLKKLYTSVVPGDTRLREPLETVKEKDFPSPGDQDRMVRDGEDFSKYDPTFQALYLFSAFSMFNHACWGANNAVWGYGQETPNRVLVWATKDIEEGEEICIPYLHQANETEATLKRTLGKDCLCKKHRPETLKGKVSRSDDDDDDYEERPSKRKRSDHHASSDAPAGRNHASTGGTGRRSYNLRARKTGDRRRR